MTVNILAVGDVCGNPGLDILSKKLHAIKKHYGVRFTVVNGENASGMGISPNQAEEIFDAGADVITLGNHTWDKRDIETYLDDSKYILRPANYAPQVPGRGWGLYETDFGEICVINLIGRLHLPIGVESPFFELDDILAKSNARITLIDFHAEATSEKYALAHYADGRVSAIWGTHTHVQTSDYCVFPKGTGFICDVGMTGPIHSVIGIKPEQSVSMFLGNPKQRFESAPGESRIECAIFEIDTDTGFCVSAEALRITD